MKLSLTIFTGSLNLFPFFFRMRVPELKRQLKSCVRYTTDIPTSGTV